MSKENLALVLEQIQLDPSLQQKLIAAPNAAVLDSPKSGDLEDRKIKSSPYSLGKLFEWKQLEETMKSVARRATLALFGYALVISAALPASAGSPDVKNVPAPQYEAWIRFAARGCEQVNGPLLAAQIEQESNWNALAVSSAGAEGIAQFKPETWAKYGMDANQNGTASPWEQEDALLTQGFYMCILAADMQNVPADRTTAMLWAYNAGPEATEAANGRPPTAEADNSPVASSTSSSPSTVLDLTTVTSPHEAEN